MKPFARFELDVETATRLLSRLPAVIVKMRHMVPGEPGAQSYEAVGSGSSVVWCDTHEREIGECHRIDTGNNVLPSCEGIPLLHVTDRTGDAAVNARALEDARKLNRCMDRIHEEVEHLLRLVRRWDIEDTTPAALRDVEVANQLLCERHLRYGYERPARSKGTKVRKRNSDGTPCFVFSEPHRLCEWCEDLARDLDRLATEAEIHSHMQGRKLRRPA